MSDAIDHIVDAAVAPCGYYDLGSFGRGLRGEAAAVAGGLCEEQSATRQGVYPFKETSCPVAMGCRVVDDRDIFHPSRGVQAILPFLSEGQR